MKGYSSRRNASCGSFGCLFFLRFPQVLNQAGDLLRRIKFLEFHPSRSQKFFFQTTRSPYPYPHPFIGSLRGRFREIKERKFGNTHGSFCRYKLYFFIIHNNFDLNILIHYKCTTFFGIMQGIRQLFYKKNKKYLQNLSKPYIPFPPDLRTPYLCNVVNH